MARQRIVLAAAASAVTGARWVVSGRGAVRVAAGLVLATTLFLGPTARPLAAWLGVPMAAASCACPPTSCRCPHGGAAGHLGGAAAEHEADCTGRPGCPRRGGAAGGEAAAGVPEPGAAATHASHGGGAHAAHGSALASDRTASHATHRPAGHGSHNAASHPSPRAGHHHGTHGAAAHAAHPVHGSDAAASHSSHAGHRPQNAASPPSHLAAAHATHGAVAGSPSFAGPADPARHADAGAAPADPSSSRCSISSHCGGGDAAAALGAQAWLRADLDPGSGWAAPAGPGEPSPPAAAARLLDPGRSPERPPPRRIAPIA